MALTKGDLVGTKNGTNDVFTLPVVPIANSEQIIMNGSILKPVGSFTATSRALECIISGQTVTVGLAPNASDSLWYICDV